MNEVIAINTTNKMRVLTSICILIFLSSFSLNNESSPILEKNNIEKRLIGTWFSYDWGDARKFNDLAIKKIKKRDKLQGLENGIHFYEDGTFYEDYAVLGLEERSIYEGTWTVLSENKIELKYRYIHHQYITEEWEILTLSKKKIEYKRLVTDVLYGD